MTYQGRPIEDEKELTTANAEFQHWLLVVAMFKDRKLVARFQADGFVAADLASARCVALAKGCLTAALKDDKSPDEQDRQIAYQTSVIEYIRANFSDVDQYSVLSAALVDTSDKVGFAETTYERAAAAVKIDAKTRQLKRNLELVNELVPAFGHLPQPPHEDWLAQLQGRLTKTARMFSEIALAMKDRLWREIVGEVRDELRRALDAGLKQAPGRLTWGMIDADKTLLKIRDGELIIVGARPSVGKSALVVTLARVNAQAKEPKRFLLFSFEDSPEQIVMRMCSQHTGISSVNIYSQPKDVQQQFLESFAEIERLNVEVINAVGMTIEQVAAKAELIHSLEPIDGVGIDYLQLVSPMDRRLPREQQVAEVSRGAKLLAGRLQRPVILLSQLNRDGERENRPPRLSDLRESGAIEQDGDRVVLLHRPSKNSQGEDQDVQSGNAPAVIELWMIQAKMRNGPTASVRVAFVSEAVKFTNLLAQ